MRIDRPFLYIFLPLASHSSMQFSLCFDLIKCHQCALLSLKKSATFSQVCELDIYLSQVGGSDSCATSVIRQAHKINQWKWIMFMRVSSIPYEAYL